MTQLFSAETGKRTKIDEGDKEEIYKKMGGGSDEK